MNLAIAAIFALTQQLLDAHPANKSKVEKIVGTKMREAPGPDELNRNYLVYETPRAKAPYSRVELSVPKNRGQITIFVDMKNGPDREAIKKQFGRETKPEYASGKQTVLTQEYQSQVLMWVLDTRGHAQRVSIVDNSGN